MIMQIKGYFLSKKMPSKLSLYKTIIQIHCLINGIKIAAMEETILAYYCMYGISNITEDLILENKDVSTIQVLRNNKSSLLRKNLIVKNGIRRYKVVKNLQLDLNTQEGITKGAIIIKLETNE